MAVYRNRKVPEWWIDYLPEEINKYKENETLTFEKGYLSEYWHIHSSNKHPNYSGASACNLVHQMIKERFGGAFLASEHFYYSGRKGEEIYHGDTDIIYDNAYLENGKIHIKNAKRYYEDVVSFLLKVLSEISKNHMQSGNDYEASCFFKETDQEIERNRIEHEKRMKKAQEYKAVIESITTNPDFMITEIEFDEVKFDSRWSFDDGWFNTRFEFNNTKINKTNEEIDEMTVNIITSTQRFYKADSIKPKNKENAKYTTEARYCIYLRSKLYGIKVFIEENHITQGVKDKIQEALTQAMNKYNDEHIEPYRTTYTPSEIRYPYNYFLDNGVGNVRAIYDVKVGIENRFYL